jgi:hypothetical protein
MFRIQPKGSYFQDDKKYLDRLGNKIKYKYQIAF